MKVLLVSRYVDPVAEGSNKNVYLQAQSMRNDFGIDVEILTWPYNDLWSGDLPHANTLIPPTKVVREGLPYHVFTAPISWDAAAGGNVVSDDDWEHAICYGIEILKSLKPDIVHLQHRHGLWWLLESAQRLGMPTIYTNHDWGLACLRTVLVMGDNTLCDGIVLPVKCAQCIIRGRGSILGRLNEIFVQNPYGEVLAKQLFKAPIKEMLANKGFVMQDAFKRATINYNRASRVIANLTYCFTPSHFGKQFFTQLGCKPEHISVLPWYHDPVSAGRKNMSNQPFTITYIGRVSPEKGVHQIFAALEMIKDSEPVLLRIAGVNNYLYCKTLKDKYPESVGIHQVEWLGWSDVGPLYQSTDVTVVPSIGMDNTPLSLIEAFAYCVPVIATRVQTIEEFVVEGVNGFLADYMSVESLAGAIRRAITHKKDIRAGLKQFPKVMTIQEYTSEVFLHYQSISG